MEKRRIIQVGTGGMGRVWVDRVVASERWVPVAYVDTNPEALRTARECGGLGEDRCFSSVDEALERVEADALLDVTPQKFRKGVCFSALGRGLPVMSEKPLADTLDNAKSIVAEAAARNLTYMVTQNYRYQGVTQTVQRFIAEGRLGDVGYVGISFHKGPHFGGFREEMAYPLILDMSIHHFDMTRCILDTDITAVQALSIDAPWNWNKGEASVMAQLETESGVSVNYFASWVSAGAETPWNANWRIEGSKGVLIWENDEIWFSDKPDARERVPEVDFPKVHQAWLIDAFAEALDTGIEPETSGRRNLNSLATTYAVVLAAEEGRRVNVSELL